MTQEETIKQLQEELEAAKFTSTFTAETLAEKEKEIDELKKQIDTTGMKDVTISELNSQIALLKAEVANASKPTVVADSEELMQARKRINELMLANQQLKEEAAESQKDIGEVMLTAKRQATRMISDAELEAAAKIEIAQQEVFNIGTRAQTIIDGVKKSQEDTNVIFEELVSRLSQMDIKDNN